MSSINLGHLAGSALPRVAVAIALACMAVGSAPAASDALTLPPGFQQTTAISGLNDPMDVEIAPGRAGVRGGEERDRSRPTTTSPTRRATTFADLRTQVHNFSSRGLLGLAIDPDFPGRAVRLRLLHARRADRRHAADVRHARRRRNDPCPGDTDDVNCIVSAARLAAARRRRAAGRPRAGARQRLVPAVPVPPRRRHRVRRGRLPVRVGRRRRALGDLGLRPARATR